jgi:hypothetical protein
MSKKQFHAWICFQLASYELTAGVCQKLIIQGDCVELLQLYMVHTIRNKNLKFNFKLKSFSIRHFNVIFFINYFISTQHVQHQ